MGQIVMKVGNMQVKEEKKRTAILCIKFNHVDVACD